MKSLKEKVELILNSKTPFDHLTGVFTKLKKCHENGCKNKAEYLTFSKYFKVRPIIQVMCGRCLYDAQHPGHEGSSIEGVSLKDIPKNQLSRVFGVLSITSLFILLKHKQYYKNAEINGLKGFLPDIVKNLKSKDPSYDVFRKRVEEHKKTVKTIYALLDYNEVHIL